MSGLMLCTLAPFAGMVINVLAQVALLRRSGGVKFRASLLQGFALGGIATLLQVAIARAQLQPADLAGYAVLASGAYVGFSYCYFNFLNLNQTSLRIRMIKEIHSIPNRSLPANDLKGRYNARQILEVRLQRLVKGGQLVEKDGVYRSGPQGEFLLLAKLLIFLRRMILHKEPAAE